jgi:hypothetical protein
MFILLKFYYIKKLLFVAHVMMILYGKNRMEFEED